MDDKELPFTEHLEELRTRLLHAVLAVVAFAVIAFAFKKELFLFLKVPLDHAFDIARLIDPTFPEFSTKMAYKDPLEPFFSQLKVSLLAAVFAAMPMVTYQAWKFIAPGLYEPEKRATVPFLLIATAMFVAGASFCYFAVLPYGYGYLLTIGGAEFEPTIMMNEYFRLTARLLIVFGVVFELPVFIVFLARLGIVSHTSLIRFRRHAIVLTFVVGAILTPPDIVTQIALAFPLVLLYEVSIIGARIVGKPRPENLDDA